MKTSLHSTGQWHHAYTEKFFVDHVPEEYKTDSGRFIWQGPQPPEIAPGFTLAIRIVTPKSSITSEIENVTRGKITWIQAPADGKANEIAILIAAKNTQVANWPGKNSMNNQPVGSVSLPNGDTVWVVHRDIELPDFSKITGNAKFFDGRSKEDLKSHGLRMHMLGEESDGSMCIYDCAGGYKPKDK
jgi:hypothetical protein